MKNVAGFVSLVMLGIFAAGCGGDDEHELSDAEIAAVEARFAQPDGTLSSANAQRVITGAKDGSASAGGVNVTGNTAATGGTTTKSADVAGSLSALGIEPQASNPFFCSSLQQGQRTGTCACPSGGSFTYALQSSGGGGVSSSLMRIELDACSSGATTIDGSEYLSIQSDTTDRAHPKMSLLFVVDVTATSGGQTKKIDLQLRYANGAGEIAVRVDDGWVIVGTKTSSRGTATTYTVRDKRGTWTCVVDGGKGTCTSDKGETQSF